MVIVTQFSDNPGRSITNEAEFLANQVYTEVLNNPKVGMTWIEHYPAIEGYPGMESYMIVTFKRDVAGFSVPTWREIAPEEVRSLLRQQEI